MKRVMPLTIVLLDFLSKAGFRLKRFTEVGNGEISFPEGSYEDVTKYSRVLLNRGFSDYTKIVDQYHNDVKSHSITNGKYKIFVTTDSTLRRSNIKIVEL